MTKGRIIIADIEKISCKEEWILSQIAQRYVEKYQKHKRETDKKQELIAGYLLKEYLGVENDAQLVMNKNGKPMLVDARKHFNLSHSGKYVVLAIADQEVGIDIERVRPYHEATAKKIFSNEIQNAISELCGDVKTGRQCETCGVSYGARRYPDAGVYECGNGGRNQGCCFNNGSQRDQMSGGTVQYLSSACASRRQADQRNGWTA